MDRHFRQQPESVRDAVDDATAAYIISTRRHFENLRQVSAQLAGLLVLAAAGSQSAGPHHPMLETAGQLYEDACEAIQSARVPVRARHHHAHLLRAARALRRALLEARAGVQIDPVLQPLRAAYAHLQQASSELPGFDMVAFDQGCCGGNS